MQHEETDSGRIRAALGRAGVRGAFSDEATQGLGLGASTAGAQVPSLVGELRSCKTLTHSHSHTPPRDREEKNSGVLVPTCSRFPLPHLLSLLAAFLNSINTDFTITVPCCNTLS